jgi:hypothetical protein
LILNALAAQVGRFRNHRFVDAHAESHRRDALMLSNGGEAAASSEQQHLDGVVFKDCLAGVL